MTYTSLTPLTRREDMAEFFMNKSIRLLDNARRDMEMAHRMQSRYYYNKSRDQRELANRLELAALWLLR